MQINLERHPGTDIAMWFIIFGVITAPSILRDILEEGGKLAYWITADPSAVLEMEPDSSLAHIDGPFAGGQRNGN